MPITERTEMAAVSEQRPKPDRSLITAIFFVIIFISSSLYQEFVGVQLMLTLRWIL